MQLNVPPDLATLINKRLSSGGHTNAQEVLRRALEAQDAEESGTDEERRALSAHIEKAIRRQSGEALQRLNCGSSAALPARQKVSAS